jgi:Serine dehydrogenase proteinase
MSYLSFSNVFKFSFSLIGMCVIVGISCYAFKKIYDLRKVYKNKQLTNNNIITVIHSHNLSIINNDTMITIKTHMDFITAYEKMDKNKDIHIIMHTVGGALSSAEAICNCIANHQMSDYEGKIIVYIPYYSYSGGCMIALACDKIIMSKNAILGPCDAQKYVDSAHSIAAIIDTVDYKKEMKEKVSETWLAGSYDAKLCKERQLEYVNRLIKSEKFTEDIGKTIYDEFFSGKYNHDKIFSAQRAKELGLNIEIVDVMPSFIKNISDEITS